MLLTHGPLLLTMHTRLYEIQKYAQKISVSKKKTLNILNVRLCNLMKKVHKFLLGHFVAYLSIIQSNVKLLKQANATCCRCLRIVVRHFPARFGGHSFKAVVLPFCYFINQATYKRSFLRGSNMQYQCRRHISLFWIMHPTTKLAAISKRDEQVNSM